MKTKCDYLNGWLGKKNKKNITHAKISPLVNPRDIAGNAEKVEVRGEKNVWMHATEYRQ